ncbi:DUF5655 domain-containing protein [Lachnoclostridium phocaeense]|uniref:DUF5655 domain-containing protein n=1 Tax=Lachnoclostridium phocaeense TaxID=1871021 RepID=UPI00248EA444|nr:DUF5655 domain-containing protein [Lachnoclostridium phocaeense]
MTNCCGFLIRCQRPFPCIRSLKERFSRVEDVHIKVQKTQITYSNRHVFACVSFAKVRKAKERPPVYIVVTFGLAYKKESPRIDIATEPYPNRWIHHVLVSREEEIDGELLGWVEEAAAFSAAK